jgi:hypothetical protein
MSDDDNTTIPPSSTTSEATSSTASPAVVTYESVLKQAKAADLKDLEQLDCIYIAPFTDRHGFPVIVLGK